MIKKINRPAAVINAESTVIQTHHYTRLNIGWCKVMSILSCARIK